VRGPGGKSGPFIVKESREEKGMIRESGERKWGSRVILRSANLEKRKAVHYKTYP